MDSGCYSSTEAEVDYDVAAPVSAEEIIWLMDELIRREESNLSLILGSF